MARAKSKPRFENIAELLESLGGVPAERVRLDPVPGTATKKDLLRFHERGRRLYELIDQTLVEKPIGHPESYIAMELGRILGNFVVEHDLGFCTGADDLIEVMPELVRGPDVCFTPWSKLPDKSVDDDPISVVIPDLAVEVLSPSNTPGEILRKLKEYFLGGVQLVWVIDHRKRSARVYTAPDKKTEINESGTLDGGDVLPGFRVPLAKLFERLKKPTKTRKPKKK